MKLKFNLIILMILMNLLISQISLGGYPYSYSNELRTDIQVNIMPLIDVEVLLTEDANQPPNTPYRYGFKFLVDLDMNSAGSWEILENGDKVWRLEIFSREAHALSVEFDQFFLSNGCTFFAYNKNYEMIAGGYSDQNNAVDGSFATPLIAGDTILLEYFEPATIEGQSVIHLLEVIHDYRDIMNYTQERDCGINVTCNDASAFQEQIDAAAWLDMGGYICSGAMLNNTAQDLTSYFMTADHCVAGENVSTFRFYFNYETTSCGGTGANYGSYAYGSQLKDRSYGMNPDYALLKISGTIYESWDVYYAGWDRSTSTPLLSCGVHHPNGDPKKINFDNDYAVSDYWDWGVPNTHWRLTWDEGGTAGGSSGSPLYNNAGRFVGQLSGGTGGDCGTGQDFYGKMSLAWSDISQWLDPIGSGVFALNGTYTEVQQSSEVTVSSPNGGEDWEIGSSHSITWTDNFDGNVSIKLYQGGSLDYTITSSTASDGSYTWTIPNAVSPGSNYKIQITSVSNTSVNDWSDGFFWIGEAESTTLYIGEIDPASALIEIRMTNSTNVAGFQFTITDSPNNINIIDSFGGASQDVGFIVSSSENGNVIGFSLVGDSIPTGDHTLLYLGYDVISGESTTLCLQSPVISDPESNSIPTTLGDCQSVTFNTVTSGDINFDDTVNVLDVVMVVNEVLYQGTLTELQLQAADVNYDNTINVLDIVIIVDIILN